MSNIDRILNKEKFVEIEAKIPKINNTLTSTSTTEGLSANQGKVLNDKATGLNSSLSNYATATQLNNLNNLANNINTTVNTTIATLNSQLNSANAQVNDLNSQLSSANNTQISYTTILSAVSSTYSDRNFKAPYSDNFLFLTVSGGGAFLNSFNRSLQKDEIMNYTVGSSSHIFYVFGRYSFDPYNIRP